MSDPSDAPLPAERGPGGPVRSDGERMLELLVARSHVMRPSDLPLVVRDSAATIGAQEALLYLADHEQRWLVPFAAVGEEHEPLRIDGTVAGRAFRTDRLVAGDETAGAGEGEPSTVWVPVIDGAERAGVLRLDLVDVDERTLARAAMLASLLAELVVTRDPYGDVIELTRRRREMTLAAELRWSQLPPLTVVAPGVSISGLLEPAYEIAGDAFDYAVNASDAHVAIFDAMGHGLEASMMVSLAVAAYRHGRRKGEGFAALYESIDGAIQDHFGRERFVTGTLGHLDCSTGRLEWVTAGHPHPLLLRNNRFVGELECEIGLPLGLGGVAAASGRLDLEPGDRVLFYSDGVVEARSPEGELFGLDRLADFLERAAASGQALPETTRRLVHQVLEHQEERLQDDATVLLVEWRPVDDDPMVADRRLEGP